MDVDLKIPKGLCCKEEWQICLFLGFKHGKELSSVKCCYLIKRANSGKQKI